MSLLASNLAGAAFRGPDLAPDTRAADLVSRLTLEEKVLPMQSTAPVIPCLGDVMSGMSPV